MAYPFPRLGSAPQTPQHLQGIESPRNVMPRSSKPITAYKRTGVILIIVTGVLFWMMSPFSSIPKQTDRIPFAHDAINEQVAALISSLISLTEVKLLRSLRRTPRLWYHLDRSLSLAISIHCRWRETDSILPQPCSPP